MAATTDNRITIDAPFDVVWSMTNDLESWPTLFNEYAEATILDRTDGKIRFRLTTRPDAKGNVWSWVSDRFPDYASRTVRAERVEPGPFEYMRLHWEYRELDDGTEMRWRQDFQMRPDAHMNDQQMADHLNRATVVNMRHIKDVIENTRKDS